MEGSVHGQRVPRFWCLCEQHVLSVYGKEGGRVKFAISVNDRDLLQFVVNRTRDGILRVSQEEAIPYLSKHSNALSIGLVESEVIIFSFTHSKSDEEILFKQSVVHDKNILFILPSQPVRDAILLFKRPTNPFPPSSSTSPLMSLRSSSAAVGVTH